jgi:hypothetical protein
MIVIYVKEEWLDTIGETADLLLVVKGKNGYVSLLAEPKKLATDSPFVYAHLARKLGHDDDKPYVLAMIPVGVISGMFDLTKKEANKLGFETP